MIFLHLALMDTIKTEFQAARQFKIENLRKNLYANFGPKRIATVPGFLDRDRKKQKQRPDYRTCQGYA